MGRSDLAMTKAITSIRQGISAAIGSTVRSAMSLAISSLTPVLWATANRLPSDRVRSTTRTGFPCRVASRIPS